MHLKILHHCNIFKNLIEKSHSLNIARRHQVGNWLCVLCYLKVGISGFISSIRGMKQDKKAFCANQRRIHLAKLANQKLNNIYFVLYGTRLGTVKCKTVYSIFSFLIFKYYIYLRFLHAYLFFSTIFAIP